MTPFSYSAALTIPKAEDEEPLDHDDDRNLSQMHCE